MGSLPEALNFVGSTEHRRSGWTNWF